MPVALVYFLVRKFRSLKVKTGREIEKEKQREWGEREREKKKQREREREGESASHPERHRVSELR